MDFFQILFRNSATRIMNDKFNGIGVYLTCNNIQAVSFFNSLSQILPEKVYQFERMGYFCLDSKEGTKDHPVFNRTVTLKDTWTRLSKTEIKI